jgi:hypothetical protein
MTDARHPDPDDVRAAQPRQSTGAGRRRGRVLIPLCILAAFVVIFLIVWLVSSVGSGDDDVHTTGNGLPAQVVLVTPGG